MKDVQCYELFGGIALKYHAFSLSFFSFDDILASFSLQRLNLILITVHMCMAWPCHSFVDGLSKKCINVHKIK